MHSAAMAVTDRVILFIIRRVLGLTFYKYSDFYRHSIYLTRQNARCKVGETLFNKFNK